MHNPAKAKPVTHTHAVNPGKFAVWNKDTWHRNVSNMDSTQVLKRMFRYYNTVGSGSNIAGR